DVLRFLTTGAAPGLAYAAGPMARVVEHGLGALTVDDAQAIATYLRDVPPRPEPHLVASRFNWGKPSPAEVSLRGTVRIDDAPLRSGAELYSGACAACHGSDGAGSADGTYPALFHNTVTGASSPANLVGIIFEGVARNAGPGT